MRKVKKQIFSIYSRKSKYTGKGESIENQIEMCREYIRIHYGEDEAKSAVVYEDEGFSGGNLERPQFRLMMEESKKSKFRAIVVYRLDRISRNIGDFANLINELSRAEIDFISVKEQFDTGSPMGRAMMYISSVFSQLERETIAERIRDNLHELAKTGRWLGGTTPTGYQSKNIITVTVDGKQKKACMLDELPEEMKLVDIIFDEFYKRQSLSKLDAFLLKNGYQTKYGNDFSRFATKGILSNPVYMIADEEAYKYLTEHSVQLFSEAGEFDGVRGIMAYNRSQQEKGRAHKINPMDEWIVSVGKHNGRIPGRIWVEIQEILERNKSKNYKKPRNNVALLSGLLRCGNCGDYMRPKLGRRALDSGERIYMYLCFKKERSQRSRCAIKNANGNILDAEIIQQIKMLGEDKSIFLQEIEKGKKLIVEDDRRNGDTISILKNEIKVNEGKITRLVKALSLATEGSETYILEQINELHEKNSQFETQISESEKTKEGIENSVIEFDLLVQMLCSFGNMVDTLSVTQKREAIRMFVKDVTWDGQMVHATLFGSNYTYELPETPISVQGHEYAVSEEDNNTAMVSIKEPLGENSK